MDFQIIDLEQGTPEWHEFRKDKIGASYASIIMGCGFQTPLELWEEIVFGKKRPTTPQMQRGTELEPKAREWVNNLLKVKYEAKIIQSLHDPWRIASLDGFYEEDGEYFLLEIKCPGQKAHEVALAGEIPHYYNAQLQHTMDVANIDEMKYCSFDGEKGVIINVSRDPVFCKKLFKAEEAFYQSIIDHNPPSPDIDDWIRVDDDNKIKLVDKRRQLVEIIAKLEKELKELEEDIVKDLPHTRCMIGSVKAAQIVRKGSIDYSKIEAIKEMDLEPYRKPSSTYWKIS